MCETHLVRIEIQEGLISPLYPDPDPQRELQPLGERARQAGASPQITDTNGCAVNYYTSSQRQVFSMCVC